MTARCPSDLTLESQLLDPEHSPVAAHVAGCPRCTDRLDRMRREGDDFARNVYPLTVDAIEQAAARPPWWRRPAFVLPLPAFAAVAAVLLLVRPASPPEGYVGAKGNAGALGLTLFTAAPSGVVPLRDGDSIRASAAVRFRVRSAAGCHLWIASVDGSGGVSRLYPAAGDRAGWIVASEQDLPGGAILDGRLGPERVYAICTPHALAWPAVESTVRAAAARPASVRAPAPLSGLPPGASWYSLLLEKRP
jgi:hypothetical protein